MIYLGSKPITLLGDIAPPTINLDKESKWSKKNLGYYCTKSQTIYSREKIEIHACSLILQWSSGRNFSRYLWFLKLNRKICNSGKDSNISKLECWWHTCMKYLGGFHQNMIAQKLISSDNISSRSSQHRKSDIHSDHWVFGKTSDKLRLVAT